MKRTKFVTNDMILKRINDLIDVALAKEEPLDYSEAAAFLKIAKKTLQNNVSDYPHHKTNRGAVYFFRSELVQFIKNSDPIQNRINSNLMGAA